MRMKCKALEACEPPTNAKSHSKIIWHDDENSPEMASIVMKILLPTKRGHPELFARFQAAAMMRAAGRFHAHTAVTSIIC